jgi:hypothetical protein
MSRSRRGAAIAAALAGLLSPEARAVRPASDACDISLTAQVDFIDADTTSGRTDNYDPELATTCGSAGGGIMFSQSGLGPDLVYGLRRHADGMVTVTLTPEAADLGLYVVVPTCHDGVFNTSCIVGDDSGGSGIPETVTFHATGDLPYFVVVDGFNGSSGAFSLSVNGLLSPLDIDGNGVIDPLTDALLILRYQFGFSGAVLTADAVGANCTRCAAAAIEFYLDGLLDSL